LPILTSKEFNSYVENKFKVSTSAIMQDVTTQDIEAEYDNA
jgi:hypothetical protein